MAELSVKIYLAENLITKEIRKFGLNLNKSDDFEYIIGRIRHFSKDTSTKDLLVFWKDEDNDYISISSDNDLRETLKGISPDADCLKLYVSVSNNEKTAGIKHPGVICDVCDLNIAGTCFKCTQCLNFDLCSSCESKEAHPDDHELLCIKRPRLINLERFQVYPIIGGCCTKESSVWGTQMGALFKHPQGDHCSLSCNGKPENNKCNSANNGKEKVDKDKDEELFLPMISQLSAAFGIDPNVAEIPLQSFCDGLKNVSISFEEKSSDKPDSNAESKQNYENPKNTMTQKVSENNKVNTDTTITERNNEPNHLMQQQDANFTCGGLEEVIGKIFGSVSNSTKADVTFKDDTSMSEKNEDFTSIDSKESVTSEQNYEKRLSKALKQMAAMGFENEEGWLRQLLISKDLSIGKVLDALNP